MKSIKIAGLIGITALTISIAGKENWYKALLIVVDAFMIAIN